MTLAQSSSIVVPVPPSTDSSSMAGEHILIISDSTLALGQNGTSTYINGSFHADVQVGRRFQRHSWTTACTHKYDRVVVVCGGNDLAKAGPRTKAWIDDQCIDKMKGELKTICDACHQEIDFIMVGSWDLWKAPFTYTDESVARDQFASCQQQLISAAREVPGVRVQHRNDDEFGQWARHDGWHFSEEAAPQILAWLHSILGTVDGGARSREIKLERVESPSLPVPKPVDDWVVDDSWRLAYIEKVLRHSSALAEMCGDAGFPDNQKDLTPELYNLLFMQILEVTMNSKSKMRISGWRRYFGDEKDGQGQWKRIQEHVMSSRAAALPPSSRMLPLSLSPTAPRRSWGSESGFASPSPRSPPVQPDSASRFSDMELEPSSKRTRHCARCGSTNDAFPGRENYGSSAYCAVCWSMWRADWC